MAIAARVSLHLSASRPLRPNVTSSIKPEVHNVAQRRRRRTEPRPQGISTKFRADRSSGSRDMFADRQTHRQTHTDRQTNRRVDHNTPHPYRGRVMKSRSLPTADTAGVVPHKPYVAKNWTHSLGLVIRALNTRMTFIVKAPST